MAAEPASPQFTSKAHSPAESHDPTRCCLPRPGTNNKVSAAQSNTHAMLTFCRYTCHSVDKTRVKPMINGISWPVEATSWTSSTWFHLRVSSTAVMVQMITMRLILPGILLRTFDEFNHVVAKGSKGGHMGGDTHCALSSQLKSRIQRRACSSPLPSARLTRAAVKPLRNAMITQYAVAARPIQNSRVSTVANTLIFWKP